MKRFLGISVALMALAVLVSATLKTEKAGIQVGDVAPDFRLENIDGKMVSLKDYKNVKGYIVTFTCNTCPFAVMYEDRIQALHEKFEPMGYPVVAIMPNDTEMKPGDSMKEMKKRAQEKGFTFAYLIDAKQEVFPKYGATRTPEIYLLDKDLKVTYTGAIDDNARDANSVTTRYVENAIKSIESGIKPDPSFTKAIGCTIKVKKS